MFLKPWSEVTAGPQSTSQNRFSVSKIKVTLTSTALAIYKGNEWRGGLGVGKVVIAAICPLNTSAI